MNNLRDLPSVDQLMQISQVQSWIDDYGRTLTLEAIRNVLDEIRKNFRRDPRIPPVEEIINRASKLLEAWSEPTLKPVINAAGVILHTNLGRAPLSQDAMRAAQEVAFKKIEKSFVNGAKDLKSLEVTEKSLKDNSKVILTEKGISPQLLIGELPFKK